jgi:hypothetical protein
MRAPLLLLTALGLVVTGCGHSPSQTAGASADATARGALVVVGGPCCHAAWHVAGTVHLDGPVVTSTPTDRHGRFRIQLPAGRYRFTATSPSLDDGRDVCTSPHPVDVRAHRTVHVRVVCDIP